MQQCDVKSRIDNPQLISHQWMSWEHADPDMEQLSVLQSVIKRIRSGELRSMIFSNVAFGSDMVVDATILRKWAQEGYIWLDFWCIPQLFSNIDESHASGESFTTKSSLPDYYAQPSFAVEGGIENAGQPKVGARPSFPKGSAEVTRARKAASMLLKSVENDLKKAVHSIPAYVEQCEHFIIRKSFSWRQKGLIWYLSIAYADPLQSALPSSTKTGSCRQAFMQSTTMLRGQAEAGAVQRQWPDCCRGAPGL